MTNHVGRLYAAAVGVVVLFLSWAAVAAHPWATTKASPQLQLIALREQALKRETALVNTILRQRAAAARTTKLIAAQSARQSQQAQPVPISQPVQAAQPSVRVVTLPPLTITKTS
ncbi:MAG: hypothetical protein ACXVZ2_06225 [Gaiellaceae bacterium]